MIARRGFIALLGAAAVARPSFLAAQAAARLPLVGLLRTGEPSADSEHRFDAFRGALRSLGWIEGETVRLAYRVSGTQSPGFAEAAEQLVALQPNVLVVAGSSSLRAVLQVTHTIPTVFFNVNDPVEQGLVASLKRPGGNATGLASLPIPTMSQKHLQLLKELAPDVTRILVLGDPDFSGFARWLESVRAVSRSLDLTVIPAAVRAEGQFEAALAEFAQEPGSAVSIVQDAYTLRNVEKLAALTTRLRLPAIGPWDNFAAAGGLISYGTDLTALNRGGATYVDRILKGANPAELPIEFPTKFFLKINLKTARALGLTVAPTLLARADEVIE